MAIATPNVRLVAHTVLADGFPDIEPQDGDTDADFLAEGAGRSCYESWTRPNPKTRKNEDYLAHIIRQGHESTLEHATATFYITGVSRALLSELTRHRHLSHCLVGDTKVYMDRPRRAGDGKRGPSQTRTLEQLWEMWNDRRRTYVKTMTIRSVSPSGNVIHQHIKEVVQSGVKPVYEVKFKNGYTVKSTADHLFMVDAESDRFVRLGDLSVGDHALVNGRKVELDDEWIIAKVNEGLSSPQIATLAECSTAFIKKRRRELGCPAALGSGTVGATPWNKGKGGYSLPKRTPEQIATLKAAIANSPHKTLNYDNWSRGHAVSNAKFPHLRESGCRMCGAKEGRIELDHIDGNPMNNDESNVQPLCVPCHKAKTCGTPPMMTYLSEIVSIEYVGEEMTYDLEMDGYHNFVANGAVVHNSVVSQRFVDSSNANVVIPPALRGDKDAEKALDDWQATVGAVYESMVADLQSKGHKRKQAREAARAVMPNMTETRIVVSGNHRAWRFVVARRIDEGADAEIREVAGMLLAELRKLAPSCYQDFE